VAALPEHPLPPSPGGSAQAGEAPKNTNPQREVHVLIPHHVDTCAATMCNVVQHKCAMSLACVCFIVSKHDVLMSPISRHNFASPIVNFVCETALSLQT